MLTSLKNYCLGFLLLAYLGSFAQDQTDPVLLSIDGQDIKVSEFEAVYKKNNQETSQEALEEYLDLYVKFRLKVRDAEKLGMDTLESFKKELACSELRHVTEMILRNGNERCVTEMLQQNIIQ